MILRCGRVLAVFALLGPLIGIGAVDVRAQAGRPNTWTTVAPLPQGLLWPGVASSAGKLYVFGGLAANHFLTTFQAYDPHANRWTSMGNIPAQIDVPSSPTTGTDGLIYLYGRLPGSNKEIMLVYQPRTNKWSQAPAATSVPDMTSLVTGRDGRIYAVGGVSGALAAYNPSTQRWTGLAPDSSHLYQSAAATGADGRIYVVGGDQMLSRVLVEAYDPRSNSWAAVAPPPTTRVGFGVVAGPDGRIYVLGGQGQCFTAPCTEVDTYDVHTGRWAPVARMPHGRLTFAAAVGPDGRIYVLGGTTSSNPSPSTRPSTEVDAYTAVPGNQPLPAPPPGPAIATQELAPMPTARYGLGAATSNGEIYAIGGQAQPKPGPKPPTVLRSVEAYNPATNTWTKEQQLPAPRVGMGATTGPDGRIYVLGGVARAWGQIDRSGYANISGLNTVFIYDPKGRHWSLGTPMPDGRYALAAVTGKDGRIYTIGGATFCHADDMAAATIEPQARPARRPAQGVLSFPVQMPGGDCTGTQIVRAFNPQTNSWTTLAPLPLGGVLPTAAVAPDGRIVVFCCGDTSSTPRSVVEVYDPAKNTWTMGATLRHKRNSGFAAATAADGRIDLIGGCLITHVTHTGYNSYCGDPSPVDAYDPRTHRWTTLGVTLNARQAPAATTGPDGRVYVVGGGGYGQGKLLEVIRQGAKEGTA